MRNPTQPETKSRNWTTVALTESESRICSPDAPIFRRISRTHRQNSPMTVAVVTWRRLASGSQGRRGEEAGRAPPLSGAGASAVNPI